MNDMLNTPTPADPNKRRNTMIAVAVGVGLLLCCCCVVAFGAIAYSCGDMIMGITNGCGF